MRYRYPSLLYPVLDGPFTLTHSVYREKTRVRYRLLHVLQDDRFLYRHGHYVSARLRVEKHQLRREEELGVSWVTC